MQNTAKIKASEKESKSRKAEQKKNVPRQKEKKINEGHNKEKLYSDLFNYSQALMCTHDMNGKLLSVNPAVCVTLEYRKEELVGQYIYEFMPEKRRNEFVELYLPAIIRESKAQGVFCVNTKSGEGVYLLMESFKVQEEGVDKYVIGFSQNITERFLAEKKLIEAQRISEDSAHAKEIFLANLSHEIRTPMNGILGIAGLLAKTALNERQHNFLRLIQDAANNLMVIVNDVLDLEKIGTGELQIEKIPFRIVDKLSVTVQSFIYKAEEKGLAIIFQNAIPGELIVIGDPFRLSQILNNILNNALKFTEQGNIIISTRIQIVEKENAVIECSVKDTGIGISEEMVAKIFQPFVQGNTSISRKYGGTGLGLAICKNLLDMQGGTLSVQSAEHVGSTFTFKITYLISEEHMPEIALPMEVNFSSLGKKKILVAEDAELNQYLAKQIMESWGFEVTIAVDGREAVKMMQRLDFDLVLMDIQMPEMDGIAATRAIRRMKDTDKANIPIIALTANAFKNDSKKYLAAGMNDYLSKPYSEPKLFQVIARNLILNKTNSTHMKTNEASESDSILSPKLYDLTMITTVSGGDEEFVKKMVDLFIETVPVNLKELNAYLESENWEMVSKMAHKLKSTIDSMGIHSLNQDIRTVEHTAKKKEALEDIPALVTKINSIVETCINQLKAEIK